MTDRLTEIRERAEARRAVSSRAIIDEHSEDADIFYLLDQIAERDAEIAAAKERWHILVNTVAGAWNGGLVPGSDEECVEWAKHQIESRKESNHD